MTADLDIIIKFRSTDKWSLDLRKQDSEYDTVFKKGRHKNTKIKCFYLFSKLAIKTLNWRQVLPYWNQSIYFIVSQSSCSYMIQTFDIVLFFSIISLEKICFCLIAKR